MSLFTWKQAYPESELYWGNSDSGFLDWLILGVDTESIDKGMYEVFVIDSECNYITNKKSIKCSSLDEAKLESIKMLKDLLYGAHNLVDFEINSTEVS